MQLPVRFRAASEGEWHQGFTENLSDSGAIIRGSAPLMPATDVEVVITLPSIDGHAGGCLTGQGRVVRSFSLASGDHDSAFAVTFTRYQLERTQQSPRS